MRQEWSWSILEHSYILCAWHFIERFGNRAKEREMWEVHRSGSNQIAVEKNMFAAVKVISDIRCVSNNIWLTRIVIRHLFLFIVPMEHHGNIPWHTQQQLESTRDNEGGINLCLHINWCRVLQANVPYPPYGKIPIFPQCHQALQIFLCKIALKKHSTICQ